MSSGGRKLHVEDGLTEKDRFLTRMVEFIEHVDGLDAVARQGSCPELSNETAKQDAVIGWKMLPEVRAVLHADYSAAIVQTLRSARKIREKRSQLVYLLPTCSPSDERDT